jgi:hypothetical protein
MCNMRENHKKRRNLHFSTWYLGAGMFIPQNKYYKRCFEAKFLRQDEKEKTRLDTLSDLGKR